jgi:putative ABC transport system permease protein
MVPIARRNLLAEKLRLAMSVAGVAFAVLLVLLVLSLYRGWSGVGKLITRLPGDVWVTQAGTSDPFHSTSILSSDSRSRLESIPGVAAVMPAYARQMSFVHGGTRLNVFYMALDAPDALPLAADVRDRYFPPQGHVNIDSTFSQKTGIGVGDTFEVLGHSLVVDHVNPGGDAVISQFAFLSASDARTIFGIEGTVNFFLLATAPGADLATVTAAAGAAIPGAEAHTSTEFGSRIGQEVDDAFLPVVGVLVGLGLVVGGAVIALTTYTSTIEKSRDFGVLKALGASGFFLYRIVIIESLIVGILGSAAGVATSAVTATLIRRAIPEFITDLQLLDIGAVLAAAVVMAIAASYLPVRRINSIDPAIVFRA